MAPEPDDYAVSLTEEEQRALRGSKFAPLPAPPTSSRSLPRLAHPGGPVKTNKAAALAKFLERKLQQPDGLKSINPDLLELAVKNAKETVKASSRPSTSGRNVRHVASFEDSSEGSGDDLDEAVEINNKKRKRKKTKVSRDIEEPGNETNKRRNRNKKKKKKKEKKKNKEGKKHKKSNHD
ncbi:nucleolar protein 58 [Carex littledalei]|uniref:Nucleolar protein 58 n=1 Tax=Carex littledalei TaxID=544730 RepID=A0A833QFP1_9POAL|nr:nucleolar protein 58 [Carex littledalei]